VHELTTLLPPPSHGSKVNPCRRLRTNLNLLQLLHDFWECLKWSCVCEVRYENGPANFEQHCAIKFWVKLGESATVTYEKLQRGYGEHSLSRAQVFRWHKSFLEGQNGRQCGKSEVSCEVRSSIDVENDQ